MAEPIKAADPYASASAKIDVDINDAIAADSLGGPDLTPREADWIVKNASSGIAFSQLAIEDKKARLPQPHIDSIAKNLVAQAYARRSVTVTRPDDRSAEREIADLIKALKSSPDAFYGCNAAPALNAVISALDDETQRPTPRARTLLAETDALLTAIRVYLHRGNHIGDSIGAHWELDLMRARDKLLTQQKP